MKRGVTLLLTGLLFLQIVSGHAAEWLTDLAKAQAQAKAENKMVLLDFTGSDWCRWCAKLNNEVFSQPEFVQYAATNLVLVKVDFPRKKAQAKKQKAANQALALQYEIELYPTIILLDAAGKQIGKTGYVKGGPTNFIGKLEAMKQPANRPPPAK